MGCTQHGDYGQVIACWADYRRQDRYQTSEKKRRIYGGVQAPTDSFLSFKRYRTLS